jgi:hypothetical protein
MPDHAPAGSLVVQRSRVYVCPRFVSRGTVQCWGKSQASWGRRAVGGARTPPGGGPRDVARLGWAGARTRSVQEPARALGAPRPPTRAARSQAERG